MQQDNSEVAKSRGAIWVIGQIILLGLIVLVPSNIGTLAVFPEPFNNLMRVLGLILGTLGLSIITISALNLGSNLTIFPRPLEHGTLIQSGLYSIVRHPIYSGVLLSALGWSLFRSGVPSLVLTIVLGIFFDRKAHQEERWLEQKFPDYAEYRTRVHKLIPWVY